MSRTSRFDLAGPLRAPGHDGPVQVCYLGASGDVTALRRSMEAYGGVTRTRVTPEVDVVVADSGVPAAHPLLRTATTLGIPVLHPDDAIDLLATWMARPGGRYRAATAFATDSPIGAPMIAGTLAVLVLVLTALGVLGDVLDSGSAPRPVVEQGASRP